MTSVASMAEGLLTDERSKAMSEYRDLLTGRRKNNAPELVKALSKVLNKTPADIRRDEAALAEAVALEVEAGRLADAEKAHNAALEKALEHGEETQRLLQTRNEQANAMALEVNRLDSLARRYLRAADRLRELRRQHAELFGIAE